MLTSVCVSVCEREEFVIFRLKNLLLNLIHNFFWTKMFNFLFNLIHNFLNKMTV